jgi:hypothetical protein
VADCDVVNAAPRLLPRYDTFIKHTDDFVGHFFDRLSG